jgi:hypothetical protein
MKRLLTFFVGLLALTTSSCALSSLLTIMPQRVVDQTVNCPTGGKAKAERFKVLSTQAWSQGVIVLYSAFCPADNAKTPMLQIFGHKVVKRNGMAWQVSSSGSYGTEKEAAPSSQLVEYGISRSSNQPKSRSFPHEEPYTILYGRVLKPKVVAVEATFDNGKTVRDENSNGVFALFSAGATGICELRILGADNQILRQEDFSVPKYLTQQQQANQCLPMSHQL